MNNFEIEENGDQENTEVFQSNIRQIETTNRLLAHIEDKLNNLIYNKRTSPKNQKFSTFTKKNSDNQGTTYNNQNGISQNEGYKSLKPGEEQTSSFFRQNPSIQNEENQENYFDNSNRQHQNQYNQSNSNNIYYKSNQLNHQQNTFNPDQNEYHTQQNNIGFQTNKNNNILINNKSRRSQTEFQSNSNQIVCEVEDISSSNRKKLDELNNLLLGKEDQQNPSPSQISSGNNHQVLGGTMEYTKSHQFNSSNKQQDFDPDITSTKSRVRNLQNQDNKFIHQQEQQRIIEKKYLNGQNLRSPQNQQFPHKQGGLNENIEESLMQRVNRMDTFYENKIKILSDRVDLLETENQFLIHQKSELNLEVIKLKQNIPFNHNNNLQNNDKYFSNNQGYKEIEKRLIQAEQKCSELTYQNQIIEREKKVLVESLQHEINEIKNQNTILLQENLSLKNELRDKSMNSQSFRRQPSTNSLMNYYKDQQMNYSSNQRNEDDQPLNTIENTANILEDIRNKYNLPRHNDTKYKSDFKKEESVSNKSLSYKVKDLNQISHRSQDIISSRQQPYHSSQQLNQNQNVQLQNEYISKNNQLGSSLNQYENKLNDQKQSQQYDQKFTQYDSSLNQNQYRSNQYVSKQNLNESKNHKQEQKSDQYDLIPHKIDSKQDYYPQQQQQQQYQTNNQYNNIPSQNQFENRLKDNSYSILDDLPSRRFKEENSTSYEQPEVVKNEIQKIKEELSRQKSENKNMVQKIAEFKDQNGISSQINNNSQNTQPGQILQSDTHLMLENYRLYASQIEKSYEKLENLYQKDVEEKQQRIEQLQTAINQKKPDLLDEESQYRLKPKIKSIKSRKTSTNKKTAKTTNSITTLSNIGRSKSMLNTSKKL